MPIPQAMETLRWACEARRDGRLMSMEHALALCQFVVATVQTPMPPAPTIDAWVAASFVARLRQSVPGPVQDLTSTLRTYFLAAAIRLAKCIDSGTVPTGLRSAFFDTLCSMALSPEDNAKILVEAQRVVLELNRVLWFGLPVGAAQPWPFYNIRLDAFAALAGPAVSTDPRGHRCSNGCAASGLPVDGCVSVLEY